MNRMMWIGSVVIPKILHGYYFVGTHFAKSDADEGEDEYELDLDPDEGDWIMRPLFRKNKRGWLYVEDAELSDFDIFRKKWEAIEPPYA